MLKIITKKKRMEQELESIRERKEKEGWRRKMDRKDGGGKADHERHLLTFGEF